MKPARLFFLFASLFLSLYVHADDDLPVLSACGSGIRVLPIHAVQGSGAASPVAGTIRTMEGVVVGDFQDGAAGVHGDLNGFAVQEQDAEADANPATSEGLFAFDGFPPAVDVAVGDQVCVTGMVREYFGETQVDVTVAGGSVVVVSTGNPLPAARIVTLPVRRTVLNDDGQVIGDYEEVEGERIAVVGSLDVTATGDLDRFGELTLSVGGRLVAFTQSSAPSISGFAAWNEDQARRSLRLDDGYQDPYPDPIPYPPPALRLAHRVRAGDRVDRLIGVMRYRRGAGPDGEQVFRLMPTAPPTFTTRNPRPADPPGVGGDVRVASFNLEYFQNGNGGTPGGFPVGGTTFSEYQRQRAKLIATLARIDADIVGLVEVENDYPEDLESAIRDLVNGLNAALGAGTYAYLDPGVMLSTAPVTVGLLYKPATVRPVGPLVYLDTPAFANPNGYAFHLNRPALTQTFRTAGGAFTVSVNHFKAKSCSPTPMGADEDQYDGQACFNDTRAQGAAELVRWLAGDPTNTAATLGAVDPDFLIIGDLNAHPMEDPLAAIKAGPDGTPGTADDYIDLLAAGDYSFVFRGAQGRLDYALASPSLAVRISDAGVWHINADEPDAFDYAEDFPAPAALYAPDPYRSSDHDPVVVGVSRTTLGTVIKSFKARVKRDAVQLTWKTQGEVDNAGFEVQQRQGSTWDVLGFVEGQGTTEKPRKYSWRVGPLAPDTYRFRLRQLDEDGGFQYSEEVDAEVEGSKPKATGQLSEPFPSPFNAQATLTLVVERSQHVRVAAYDLLGREVAVLFDALLAGGTPRRLVFDAGGLPTGMYILRARGETFTASRRVVMVK